MTIDTQCIYVEIIGSNAINKLSVPYDRPLLELQNAYFSFVIGQFYLKLGAATKLG